MKILVIDDDVAVAKCIDAMLSEHEVEVDATCSAEAAVDQVESGDYDFLLLDYKMPEKDGLWFMRNARIPRRTKTLLVTAFVNRKVINEMFQLGAVGYLMKPFAEEDLLKHLKFHSG